MYNSYWGRGSVMPFEAHCARANRSRQNERERLFWAKISPHCRPMQL